MKVTRVITETVEIRELKKEFVTVAVWLKVHKHRKHYQNCYFCGESLSNFPGEMFVGLTITDKGNKQICENCSDKYIKQNTLENGALKIY